jgi:TonB family protein
MTVRPEILNAPKIVRAMVQAYPPVLRDSGIGGTVVVFFLIDEAGQVGNAVLERSSGHAALDQAALEIARLYRFRPALNRDQVLPVWVAFPLTFRGGREQRGLHPGDAPRAGRPRLGYFPPDVRDGTALSPLLRSGWEGPC